MFLAHLGKLDQHGKIDACEHFPTLGRLMQDIARLEGVPPNMSVRIATPSPLSTQFTASMMSASTQIEVILGSNRDRFNLLLRTHDMFEHRLELVGKAPIGSRSTRPIIGNSVSRDVDVERPVGTDTGDGVFEGRAEK